MKKYPLIGISIVAVVLLVLGSFNNIVGYQTVQASNQKVINDEVSPKELLFQTIVDIANNKEMQRVILVFELTSKRAFDSDVKFSTFKFPLITEKLLNRIYTIGSIFFKTYSKSKMHSILQQYQISNQEAQKEINAVIEKDTALNEEIAQLSALKCDCEKDKTISLDFPVICEILAYMFLTITIFPYILFPIWVSAIFIAIILNCTWTQP
jgi:hypothetical protein